VTTIQKKSSKNQNHAHCPSAASLVRIFQTATWIFACVGGIDPPAGQKIRLFFVQIMPPGPVINDRKA
jgi:hypothetical protein